MGEVGSDPVEVVGGHHDRQATGVEVVQQVEHFVAGLDVDAGGGFVHQQELGAGEQGPGDEHPLLLAPGQLADVAITELGDTQALQHLGHLELLLPAGPGEQAPGGTGHEHALAHGDREVPVDGLHLGHVGGGQPRPAPDRAGEEGNPSHDGPEQRRLSRARRSHHPAELTGDDGEVDVDEDSLGPVGARHPLEGDQHLVGDRPGHWGYSARSGAVGATSSSFRAVASPPRAWVMVA